MRAHPSHYASRLGIHLVVLSVLAASFSAAPSIQARERAGSRLQENLHAYTSSHDGVTLYMRVIYPDGGTNRPIIAVMHGYSGAMEHVYAAQEILADRGLFTVAPAMRGRDGSGGVPDDSAWELTDIVDAIEAVKQLYPAETDEDNVNLLGYSGGGGNVFGCLSKFPDTFRFAAAFFGMSDYGHDPTYGWYAYGGTGYQATLRQRIGGAPEEVPDRYMARNSLLAVENNRYTTFQMYVDEEENVCPAYNDTTYLRLAENLGHTNVSLNMSGPDSLHRWLHGYPPGSHLVYAFSLFVPYIMLGSYPPPDLEPVGHQTVLGYLSVTPYRIVLGDGMSEVAGMSYDVSGTAAGPGDAWQFEIQSRTARIDSLRIELRGLRPTTLYAFEHEDLTHGEFHQTMISTDRLGRLDARAFVDTLSCFRFYEAPVGDATDPASRADPPAAQTILALRAFPNPCNGILNLQADLLGQDQPCRALICDINGRPVSQPRLAGRSIRAASGGPGAPIERLEFQWDGRDRKGQRLPGGLYFAVLRCGSRIEMRRVIVVER